MYLHNDKGLFEEVIYEVNAQTGIAQLIIEKDYYVTRIINPVLHSSRCNRYNHPPYRYQKRLPQ